MLRHSQRNNKLTILYWLQGKCHDVLGGNICPDRMFIFMLNLSSYPQYHQSLSSLSHCPSLSAYVSLSLSPCLPISLSLSLAMFLSLPLCLSLSVCLFLFQYVFHYVCVFLSCFFPCLSVFLYGCVSHSACLTPLLFFEDNHRKFSVLLPKCFLNFKVFKSGTRNELSFSSVKCWISSRFLDSIPRPYKLGKRKWPEELLQQRIPCHRIWWLVT